jgi:hypothetical protein
MPPQRSAAVAAAIVAPRANYPDNLQPRRPAEQEHGIGGLDFPEQRVRRRTIGSEAGV